MAQYKVPQDVEAEDKLIGPFGFRQFVYLLIAGALIATAVGLFQIFPFLAIIPVPFIIFFLVLALPLKKDQPMETYLAAVLNYYFKPRRRVWIPGQRDTTVEITAPKKAERSLTRDISGEEAGRRLSFLANVIDTEGNSIHNSNLNADFVAEANTAEDIFEDSNTGNLNAMINIENNERREAVVEQMRTALQKEQKTAPQTSTVQPSITPPVPTPSAQPTTPPAQSTPSTPPAPSPVIIQPVTQAELEKPKVPQKTKPSPKPKKRATIKHKKKEDEVYISLH